MRQTHLSSFINLGWHFPVIYRFSRWISVDELAKFVISLQSNSPHASSPRISKITQTSDHSNRPNVQNGRRQRRHRRNQAQSNHNSSFKPFISIRSSAVCGIVAGQSANSSTSLPRSTVCCVDLLPFANRKFNWSIFGTICTASNRPTQNNSSHFMCCV